MYKWLRMLKDSLNTKIKSKSKLKKKTNISLNFLEYSLNITFSKNKKFENEITIL